jgi:hypothetical protein
MACGAGLTVLNISDMSRCVSCRRLVTLRRILGSGSCKCGSRKLVDCTFLDSADLLEIEEDYGWDVKITGVAETNVSKGLLSTGNRTRTPEGGSTLQVNEGRLHSRGLLDFKRSRDAQAGFLGRARAVLGLPVPAWARDFRKLRDYAKSLRPVQVRGGHDPERTP